MINVSLPKYVLDCYLKEYETIVKQANEKYIVLEDTIFYPDSGGQPHDEGTITKKDGKLKFIIAETIVKNQNDDIVTSGEGTIVFM